ncbi:hypothetical protein OSB04_017066 [Centaurea solstitialis]|uniref:Uncharacterized protein n=1 Tax=Centaurea solstitialis TaxID=347529 RepID=A0AA38TFE1_9ASTR|nr:hypothetical protein OSB04_017066 [Centaurea solstitialis]
MAYTVATIDALAPSPHRFDNDGKRHRHRSPSSSLVVNTAVHHRFLAFFSGGYGAVTTDWWCRLCREQVRPPPSAAYHQSGGAAWWISAMGNATTTNRVVWHGVRVIRLSKPVIGLAVWSASCHRSTADHRFSQKKLCYQQIHFKSESKYIEEDWKLSELSLLSLSLPYEVYHSLVNFPTTKEIWSTLSVLYERSAEVKKSKKITLIRKYEFFSHERGESLTNYYNRFNSLLNDLLLMGKLYDNEEVLNKFMDGLPDF